MTQSELNRGFLFCGADDHHREEAGNIGPVTEQPIAERVELFHIAQAQHEHDIGLACHGLSLRYRFFGNRQIQKAAHVLLSVQL